MSSTVAPPGEEIGLRRTRRRLAGVRSLRQKFGPLFAVGGLVAVLSAVVGASSMLSMLTQRRVLVDRLDPAVVAASERFNSLMVQETGLRGFVLSGDPGILALYEIAQATEAQAARRLEELLVEIPGLREVASELTGRVVEWRERFAGPELAEVRRDDPRPRSEAELSARLEGFGRIRSAHERLASDLTIAREEGRANLDRATLRLVVALVLVLASLAAVGVAMWLAFQRVVARPLRRLREDARRVAGGELGHAVSPGGPLEVAEVAADVELMQARIAQELETVAAQAEALSRSNRDLEQFAYVASHDLQEPLRKVASFCQLLQQRYQGRLDERADLYIDFAVDGAKRMQELINDLLAFSRVGRSTEELRLVDCSQALNRALRNLEAAREETQLLVHSPDLPEVRGDLSLLAALFQNLIANSIKFRSEERPEVEVKVSRRESDWLFSLSDNGIGIQPRHAERVFVIFQRLHSRDEYSGTGIGLALCKRIVEYLGGEIWVDLETARGTTICWTLPAESSDG
ncbi:MAG: sensor histidine kinase [Acidimicrobiia bacterium]